MIMIVKNLLLISSRFDEIKKQHLTFFNRVFVCFLFYQTVLWFYIGYFAYFWGVRLGRLD
jgi:hypothetical protein